MTTTKKFFAAAIVGGIFVAVFFAVRCRVRHENALPSAPEAAPAETQTLAPATDFFHREKEFLAGVPVFDAQKISEKNSGFVFRNGDIFSAYGGGREYLADDGATDDARDNRVWIDAKLPLDISTRLKLYGVSTLTLGDIAAREFSDYKKTYGVGGGIGVSYKITPFAELNFDVRRTKTIDSEKDGVDDDETDSFGISVKLSF